MQVANDLQAEVTCAFVSSVPVMTYGILFRQFYNRGHLIMCLGEEQLITSIIFSKTSVQYVYIIKDISIASDCSCAQTLEKLKHKTATNLWAEITTNVLFGNSNEKLV